MYYSTSVLALNTEAAKMDKNSKKSTETLNYCKETSLFTDATK